MTHSKDNSPGSERRKFRRVRVNLVVVYREDEPLDVRIRAGGAEHASTMVDICEEGISILTDINVSVGTLLWIRFTLAEPKSKGLDFYGTAEIRGKVLYSMLTPTGHYRMGIHFFDLKDKERRLIVNFVEIVDKKLSIDGEETIFE